MKYIVKKTATLIITLFIISLLAFLAFQIIPGDPTTKIMGTNATPEAAEALRIKLGLDQPVLIRYIRWLKGFLHGDMGTSYSYNYSVSAMLKDKLPVTAILTVTSFIITIVIALPLGVLAGSVKNKVLDHMIMMVDQLVMSIPPFFTGIMICYLCGLVLRLFVPGRFVSYTTSWQKCIAYLIFPAVAIALPRIAMTIKMLRSSIMSELEKDYVRTAISRGNSRWGIIIHHVLRNAMIPIITFLAISMAEIMTGTIIIEQVFTIPGIGLLLMASINNRDFMVVQAIVVIMAAWIVLMNFLADIINQIVDPRMKLE